MIRRSHTRDNPSDRAAFNVSGSFGTRAADTILAAVDLAASTDRTYDRTRPGTLTQKSSCRQGAVHIRGPGRSYERSLMSANLIAGERSAT